MEETLENKEVVIADKDRVIAEKDEEIRKLTEKMKELIPRQMFDVAIQAAVGRLLAADVEFLTGPQRIEVRPGTYLAFCRDPEGNVLEIVQYADIAAYRPDLQPRTA